MSLSQHNFKGNSINMSQPAALCRNEVQAEIKEEIELFRDKDFSVMTLLRKSVKEFIMTLFTLSRHLSRQMAEKPLSRQSLLCCNIKE